MRITIEIEDGAVRASHHQTAGLDEAVNAGGPPADLLQLLGPPPRPAPRAAGADPVNIGGPPAELLRALGGPRGVAEEVRPPDHRLRGAGAADLRAGDQ